MLRNQHFEIIIRGQTMECVPGHLDLESVIITSQLVRRRPRRPHSSKQETKVTLELVEDLAKSPRAIFQKLADAILELCHAESAGISLLTEDQTQFYWPAVSGKWQPYIGDGTPRAFGPCGTVLDRNSMLLFSRPERHFAYLTAAKPTIEEGLLAPFYAHGVAVGTIWAITHTPGGKFDSEDARALENLSSFTSLAYNTLTEIGALSHMHWARLQPNNSFEPNPIRSNEAWN